MLHCSPWAISFFASAEGKAVHDGPPLAVLMERVVTVEGAPAGKQLFSMWQAGTDRHLGGLEEGFIPVLRAPFLMGTDLPKVLI